METSCERIWWEDSWRIWCRGIGFLWVWGFEGPGSLGILFVRVSWKNKRKDIMGRFLKIRCLGWGVLRVRGFEAAGVMGF